MCDLKKTFVIHNFSFGLEFFQKQIGKSNQDENSSADLWKVLPHCKLKLENETQTKRWDMIKHYLISYVCRYICSCTFMYLNVLRLIRHVNALKNVNFQVILKYDFWFIDLGHTKNCPKVFIKCAFWLEILLKRADF